jgi:uncharacterized protein (TIGR03435 family)
VSPESRTDAQTIKPPAISRSIDWSAFLLGGYLAGALVLLLRLGIGTLQANRLHRGAVLRDGRLTSEQCVTPITVGWFKPILILPGEWQQWSRSQLDVVLTHEHEHARRRDPLFQWLALLNRAVFWFHPLAWWLERRLSILAEEACDAAVLAAGHSPQDYSEYLLQMARTVSRAHGRVQMVGMAMPGTGLSHRMRLIIQALPSTRPSRTRLACTVAFCVASSGLFASGTLTERDEQPARAQHPRQDVVLPASQRGPQGNLAYRQPPRPPAAAGTRQTTTQTQKPVPGMQIKFEVVSIKPCLDTGNAAGGRGGGNSPRFAITPGYVSWGCVTLEQLIDNAWGGGSFPENALLNTIRVPPGRRADLPKRIRGGPSWVDDERFAIEIRISGDNTDLTGSARHQLVNSMMGPALRAMLEDRFQLKLRKATEEVPMYALAIAPGGLKMTPVDPNKCYEVTAEQRAAAGRMLPPAPPGFEGTLPCGFDGYSAQAGNRRGNESMDFTRIQLKDLALWLSREMDRYVLDKTGVNGRFNFRLEFAPDESTPGTTETREEFRRAGEQLLRRPAPEQVKGDGPTIFKALEVLGLTLQKTKGPAEYLVIDSVQRPRPN